MGAGHTLCPASTRLAFCEQMSAVVQFDKMEHHCVHRNFANAQNSFETDLDVVVLFACRSVPLHIKVFNFEIIAIGVVGGIAGTVIACINIVGSVNFVPPCYVNLTAASLANET